MATGAQVGKEAADIVLVTKSVRIFMIAPVVLVASLVLDHGKYDSEMTVLSVVNWRKVPV